MYKYILHSMTLQQAFGKNMSTNKFLLCQAIEICYKKFMKVLLFSVLCISDSEWIPLSVGNT
mgnify:FL=1